MSMNSNLKALSGYCILILVVFKSFVHIAWLMHNLVQQSIILLITQVQLDITKGGQYCQLISNIYNIYIYIFMVSGQHYTLWAPGSKAWQSRRVIYMVSVRPSTPGSTYQVSGEGDKCPNVVNQLMIGV